MKSQGGGLMARTAGPEHRTCSLNIRAAGLALLPQDSESQLPGLKTSGDAAGNYSKSPLSIKFNLRDWSFVLSIAQFCSQQLANRAVCELIVSIYSGACDKNEDCGRVFMRRDLCEVRFDHALGSASPCGEGRSTATVARRLRPGTLLLAAARSPCNIRRLFDEPRLWGRSRPRHQSPERLPIRRCRVCRPSR